MKTNFHFYKLNLPKSFLLFVEIESIIPVLKVTFLFYLFVKIENRFSSFSISLISNSFLVVIENVIPILKVLFLF